MFYRKYRPRTFGEVVGQSHVVATLQGALETGRIGHAYLFCGPRGTGKTTLARIFAKSLNCANLSKISSGNFVDKLPARRNLDEGGSIRRSFSEGGSIEPCNKCDSCLAINEGRSLDLIEIDAASNRGIDEIRNLKESALTAATGGKFKIFVIDEVHALTKDAFNALLKILEEPPAHVVFVLATTEPHKILLTVLSRVQRFDFKRLMPKEIVGKLKDIAKAEDFSVEDEGLWAIASASDGALRDAEVALSKIRPYSNEKGAVSAAAVNEILGLIPAHFHPEFLGYLVSGDRAGALDFAHRIYESGVDLENFSKEFIEYLRKIMISKVSPSLAAAFHGNSGDAVFGNFVKTITTEKLVAMINIFSSARNEIKSSPIPLLPIELALLELLSCE